jgi:hypothetical protein
MLRRGADMRVPAVRQPLRDTKCRLRNSAIRLSHFRGALPSVIRIHYPAGPVIKLSTAFSVLMCALFLPGVARAFEPTDSYTQQNIEGWTVRVSANLDGEHAELKDRLLALLRVRLFEVNRALPPKALGKLRSVPVWVELDDPKFPGMCFHPSADWLRDNGFNPEKAGGIEIGNAQHFLDWSDQPAMVLHELAHAYHHLVLKHDNADLRAAFEAARSSGKYDSVLRASGTTERAYAMENVDEYFAELSEAYFSTNDFYPFVRAELKKHDPDGFALIRKLWTR